MKFDKKKIIICLVVLVIIVVCVLFLVLKKDNTSDALKFSSEYKDVPINNKYEYINIKEAIQILRENSGVLFIGFKNCVWCQDYAKYLNESLIDSEIDKIYYLDIYKDRKNNSKKYNELVRILNNYLPFDNEGNREVLVPATVFINNGNVVGYNDDTAYVSSDMTNKKEYWNEDRIKLFKSNIEKNIELISSGVCKSDSKC